MNFSDEFSEPIYDRFDEEEVEKRIATALSIIEEGQIFSALNTLEETAQLCIEYDYPVEGLMIVDAVLKTITYNADFWLYKGTFNNSLGEFEEAYLALQKALELSPNDTEALINDAIAKEGLGMINEALSSLEFARDIEPTNVDVLLSLASLYEKIGENVQAVNILKQVTSIDSENSEAWYEMGYSLENLNRLDESILAYDKYIELEPESYYGWYNKGIVLIQKGDFKEAIEHFEFSIMLNSEFQSAYFNIGICYLTLEKYSDAIDSFAKAVKLDPNDETAWLYLGKSFYGENKINEALTALNKAIELDESFLEAYMNRGKIFEKLGKRTEALLDFNRVFLFLLAGEEQDDLLDVEKFEDILNFANKPVKENLYLETLGKIDSLLLFSDNGKEALELISILEKKYPDDTQILLRKSLIYFEFGQYEKGITSFRNAVSKDKNLQQKLKKDFTGLLDSGLLREIIEGK